MEPALTPLPALNGGVLELLRQVVAGQGLGDLARRLQEMHQLVQDDLAECAAELDRMPRKDGPVARSAIHLIDCGGKRLRPMCVALSARLGHGFDQRARSLAVAAELVHNATLLHDDVVDAGDKRRGVPTARTIYGDSASVFAGDWLLVEALRRVRAAEVPGTFDTLLDAIEEMIAGESIQLERRGKVRPDREAYFRVARGKTGALFRWACMAGGLAGGLSETHAASLATFGNALGVAFQLSDDLLDITGSAEAVGKPLFADIREGKQSFPLVLTLEREPSIGRVVEQLAALPPELPMPTALLADVRAAVDRTGALTECQQASEHFAAQAIEALHKMPSGGGKDALTTLALAIVHRDR